MASYLLELGTEEIPARFQPDLKEELFQRMKHALEDADIEYSGLSVDVTPRRATLFIAELAPKQRVKEEVVTGPPARIAFDAHGEPTPAAVGFARTQGVDISRTFKLETEKGTYLAVKKTVGGETAERILAEICPALVSALSFPKRMRWGDGEFTFARPLRWIVSLLDDKVVPFTVGTVAAGHVSRGHRVHGAPNIVIPRADQYFEIMERESGVCLCAEKRKRAIVDKGNRLAAFVKGVVIWKESLLDEVVGLVEHPHAIMGNIDEKFLELPREVMLTSMEVHQKSFGVEGRDGKLLPYFLTVLNISPKDEDMVRVGWERVLRARLEDARFFWEADLQAPLDDWLTRLDSVIFLAGLGSMGDKTRRLEGLCAWIAAKTGFEVPEDAKRAGRLSKADLVSGMVGEFDTLQGIMGGIYAARKGESLYVSDALKEQYLPAGPDSPLPATLLGAILSIADKADTLAGCFGLNMIPTGAADPFALRRCALGIIRIMVEFGFQFDVEELFAKAQALYGDREWKLSVNEARARLMEFYTLRAKNFLVSKGFETLLVEAACGKECRDIWLTNIRIGALSAFAQSPEFNHSVLTFKRAANIIRKQGAEAGAALSGCYERDLLREPAELALADKLEEINPVFDELWEKHDFMSLFALLGELRPSVDGFFENVMVMCEEQPVRLNRLNLLQALVSKLCLLADFNALQV